MESRRPAVFIHGLWLHASSWGPWMDLFREEGYEPVAPGWPNEPESVAEARQLPERVANLGIDDVTAHYAKIIGSLETAPVLVGHSFGGLITEKLLDPESFTQSDDSARQKFANGKSFVISANAQTLVNEARKDIAKIPGMTPESAEQLLGFLSELTDEDGGEAK